jgi:CRP-like cAMP-binding protein
MSCIEELREIPLLEGLSDEALQSILDISDVLELDKGELIYQKNERAERFYFVLRGGVLLERNVSDAVVVSVDHLKPGYCFGFSALAPLQLHNHDAVADEASVVVSVDSARLRDLTEAERDVGCLLMGRLVRLVNERLNLRTDQFLAALASQVEQASPRELFGDSGPA